MSRGVRDILWQPPAQLVLVKCVHLLLRAGRVAQHAGRVH